jgi:hypothetical protein
LRILWVSDAGEGYANGQDSARKMHRKNIAEGIGSKVDDIVLSETEPHSGGIS